MINDQIYEQAHGTPMASSGHERAAHMAAVDQGQESRDQEPDQDVIEIDPDDKTTTNAHQREATIGSQGDGETSSTCMICMEEWTIGSAHRLCCLKCGHLFGRSCIERWIKEKSNQAKCPTCNKSVKKADIRDLWCKTIKASDSTELCELQRALDLERRARKTDMAIKFAQDLKIDMLHSDLEKLRKILVERDRKIEKLEALLDKINKLRAAKLANGDGSGGGAGGVASNHDNFLEELERMNPGDEDIVIDVNVQPRELKGVFHFAEKFESSPTGGCRSFAICPTSSIILVAQPAPPGTTNVFGAFGLRKYSVLDTNVREFIPLHSKNVTSIQLKPVGDLMLTASQDKKIKLTSINNNTCVQNYQSQFEPTCVAWSADRDQQFYVGSGNCYVTLYDIRNTSEFIYQTSQRVASTRLLSVASTTDTDQRLNGLLVNDSRGTQFLEVSENSFYDSESIDRNVEHLKCHQLPFAGLMGTVDFHKKTGLSLVTTRKTPMDSQSTHNVVKLKKDFKEDGTFEVKCERVKTFMGRSPDLLSQSRILDHPTVSESVLVGACDDSAHGIKLWDASDNTEFQKIRTDVFIRDMLMFTPEQTNQHILYTLSDKSISIYRWDYA